MSLLRDLVATPALSGHEAPLRDLVSRELEPLVDEVSVDALGNVVGLRRGTSSDPRRVLVTAHMDQIGFLVRDVDAEGFVRLQPIGWVDPRYYLAQRCRILLGDDTWLRGVITAYSRPPHGRAPHEMTAAASSEDLFVQVLDPVPEHGIEIGAPVVIDAPFFENDEVVAGGPLDDRVGVWALLEALRAVPDQPDDLLFLFATQEEVGLRGAGVAGHRLAPNVAIAVDVAGAHDVPASDPRPSTLRLGGGVGFKVMDHRSISDVPLRKGLQAIARGHDIAHQVHVEPVGGTDAAALQLSGDGVPAVTLSIPTRFLHTPIEIVAKADLDACRALVAAAIARPLADYVAPTLSPARKGQA